MIIEVINLIIQAFIAVWGDFIRHILFSPKLNIKLYKEQIGEFGTEHKKTIYYHLKLVNTKNSVIAKDCRVV